MVLKAEQERVHALLKDTITLLCKNGLSFKSEFSVEALIGITLDKNDVFLININEIIRSETCQKATEYDRQGDVCSEEERDVSSEANSDGEQQPRRKQRKRRHKQIKTEVASGDEEASESNNGPCDDLQQQALESRDSQEKDDEQKQSPADEKKVVKSDKVDEPVQDIIIIKEETNEDWSQFGDMGTFPSGSAADISEATSNEQSFMSPSSSFMQSQPGTFDWSQGAAMNQNQFAAGTGTSSIDPNQQMRYRPYLCTACGKRFANKYNLGTHLKRHRGEYVYHCPICNKGFCSKSNLQGHMSWHTGVKEYTCGHCQKEFRYEKHLKQHLLCKH